MGARLAEAGALRSPRDVFFLTQSEVLAALAGEGAVDLPRLIAARRREFERYRAEPPPPSRFESVGPPRAPRASEYPHLVGSTGSRLKGLGCSAGVVRAPVRIVRDPRREGGLGGHILVAERTDPGWTVLFPLAVGLLVERGSLLSHSATVAREMGLPCIVSVHGLTHGLQDGEMVEMDGTAGTVIRLPSPVTGQAES
jgi:rifampicin phosphotransferase